MQIKINDLTITIYNGEVDKPLVLLHENENEGEAIWNNLAAQNISCTLASIRGMKWEHDLSPWEAPAAFKKAEPFTGGADEHLELIVSSIIPKIVEATGHDFAKKYIAGYSLAGLFAMYATYKTDIFDGFVSASGSMWFPGFVEYAKANEISKNVKEAYFSIGDKEAKTKNTLMQSVEDNTRDLEKWLANKGISTMFELNPGGHFVDDDIRLTKGIAWIA